MRSCAPSVILLDVRPCRSSPRLSRHRPTASRRCGSATPAPSRRRDADPAHADRGGTSPPRTQIRGLRRSPVIARLDMAGQSGASRLNSTALTTGLTLATQPRHRAHRHLEALGWTIVRVSGEMSGSASLARRPAVRALHCMQLAVEPRAYVGEISTEILEHEARRSRASNVRPWPSSSLATARTTSDTRRATLRSG